MNTTDRNGGAGIAASRLGQALSTQGIKAPLFCLHRKTADHNTFRYRIRTSELSRSLATQREALQRIQSRFVTNNRTSVSKTIFSEPWANGVLVADNPIVAKSRIIHLHWINHFLDLHSLEELGALGAPLVWTLHDEWLYTAGCHYTTGCDSFRSQCRQCPQLLHDPYQLVEQWFEQKRSVIDKLNLTIVTPSKWLGQRAQESTLLKNKPVKVIRNPFDVDVFKPSSDERRAAFRRQHGFDSDTIVLGFGAQSLADKRKGFGLLIKALALLANQTNITKEHKIGLLLFGSRSPEVDSLDGSMKVSYAGKLTDEVDIAQVLGALDCFIVPSLEENYPNVTIESLLCQTPVIAYSCGGIPEQIDDGINGILVDQVGSVEGLQASLERFIRDKSLRTSLRNFDRNFIASLHSYQTIGNEMAALYRSLDPQFSERINDDVVCYLNSQSEKKGPSRDFMGIPSYKVFADSLSSRQLIRETVDAAHQERVSAEKTSQERLYQGFFDERHEFRSGSMGRRFLNFGWSAPEQHGIWSTEKRAGIAFHAPADIQRMKLNFTAHCMGASQVVILRIGNKEIGRVKLGPTKAAFELSFEIPDFASVGGLMQIHLDFPHAQKEKTSTRLLGIFLIDLVASYEQTH